MSKHLFRRTIFYVSKVKCKVCGGWGGEFGDAKGVGPMCSSCYFKTFGSYD